jgi:hypothetical protein
MCLAFSREISCSKTLDNNSSFRQEISFNLSGCGSVTVEQRDVSLEIAAIYTRFHKYLVHRPRVLPLRKYLYGIFDKRVGRGYIPIP